MGLHLQLAEDVRNVTAATAQDPAEALYVGDWREAAIFVRMHDVATANTLLRIQAAAIPEEGAFADLPEGSFNTNTPISMKYFTNFGNYLRWRRAWASADAIGFSIDVYLKRQQQR
ncbi:MAG: hypothetical protein FJ125_01745 [Deltaproteobacteria bacterium]|nr:hypothetical protein [Deltaproteobacteria bacterium]